MSNRGILMCPLIGVQKKQEYFTGDGPCISRDHLFMQKSESLRLLCCQKISGIFRYCKYAVPPILSTLIRDFPERAGLPPVPLRFQSCKRGFLCAFIRGQPCSSLIPRHLHPSGSFLGSCRHCTDSCTAGCKRRHWTGCPGTPSGSAYTGPGVGHRPPT